MKKDEIIEIVLSSLRNLPGLAGSEPEPHRCTEARVKEVKNSSVIFEEASAM